jgi:hypothetical protein
MTLPAPDTRTKIKYQLLEIYAKNNADHRIKATLFKIIYAFQFCLLAANKNSSVQQTLCCSKY